MVGLVGQTLQSDMYTVERELGKGRFGITYLARDGKGNRLVIKSLSNEGFSFPILGTALGRCLLPADCNNWQRPIFGQPHALPSRVPPTVPKERPSVPVMTSSAFP